MNQQPDMTSIEEILDLVLDYGHERENAGQSYSSSGIYLSKAREIYETIEKTLKDYGDVVRGEEEKRLTTAINKLKLTDNSLYNYHDIEKNQEIAKKMTGAYNAALIEVVLAMKGTNE